MICRRVLKFRSVSARRFEGKNFFLWVLITDADNLPFRRISFSCDASDRIGGIRKDGTVRSQETGQFRSSRFAVSNQRENDRIVRKGRNSTAVFGCASDYAHGKPCSNRLVVWLWKPGRFWQVSWNFLGPKSLGRHDTIFAGAIRKSSQSNSRLWMGKWSGRGESSQGMR